MRVVVQVFALAEPRLERTLDAHAACRVPPFISTIRYEACVTPRSAVANVALGPADTTTLHELLTSDVATARRHPVFEVVETPPGKLASRNVGHARAFDAGADVVVCGDAEAPPLDDRYLDALLVPFETPGPGRPVAANARPVAPWTPLGSAVNALGWFEDRLTPHMNGQGHALARAGWQAAGPFDETAEADRDARAVRHEEEFAFRERLEAAGPVVDAETARMHNDLRRHRCRLRPSFRALGIEEPAYCRRIGVESFGPITTSKAGRR